MSKKTYSTPSVTVLGTIRDLTQGTGGSVGDNGTQTREKPGGGIG